MPCEWVFSTALGCSENETPGAQGNPCFMVMWLAVGWGMTCDPSILAIAAAPEPPGCEMFQASFDRITARPYKAFMPLLPQ